MVEKFQLFINNFGVKIYFKIITENTMLKFKNLIFFIILISSLPVISQTRPSASVAIQTSTDATVFTHGFCKFGMQFIATSLSKPSNSYGTGGLAVIQVIGKEGNPMLCEEK